MPKLDIDLDEVELAQLERFCSVNNCTKQEAAQMLVQRKLQEWVDSLVLDGAVEQGRAH